jgi:hypothetical protein
MQYFPPFVNTYILTLGYTFCLSSINPCFHGHLYKTAECSYYSHIDTHGKSRGTIIQLTSFARRPAGAFTFTHGQARGTLPFGDYKVDLANLGGMVMPVILMFTYADGSESVERIPGPADPRSMSL